MKLINTDISGYVELLPYDHMSHIKFVMREPKVELHTIIKLEPFLLLDHSNPIASVWNSIFGGHRLRGLAYIE